MDYHIEAVGLTQYIVEMSNRDRWNDVRKLISVQKKIPGYWYVIHWVNEEWRRNLRVIIQSLFFQVDL